MSRRSVLQDIYGDRSWNRYYKNTLDDDDMVDSYDWGASKAQKGKVARCYESHPPLKLPGTDLVIYGGSCSLPVITDADIYIGFDASMKFTERQWPWNKGQEILFRITDMAAPDNPNEFKKLVEWTRGQLEAGAKIHCGCIGGHGRTGTFLAALVSTFGEKDAIKYVRENYCQKAVESTVQVAFLNKHFGIISSEGSKAYSTIKSAKAGLLPPAKTRVFEPMKSSSNIWGKCS